MAWDGQVNQRHLCYAAIGIGVYMTLGALVADCLPQARGHFRTGQAPTLQTFWRRGGRWLRPHAVMVRGRTGVRRRGKTREPPPRLSVAWMPQEPGGTV